MSQRVEVRIDLAADLGMSFAEAHRRSSPILTKALDINQAWFA